MGARPGRGKCKCKRCHGAIDLRDDQCNKCNADDGVHRTTLVLAKMIDVRPAYCWRCIRCDLLFFQGERKCPKCSGPTSGKETEVFVRVRAGMPPKQKAAPSKQKAVPCSQLDSLLLQVANMSDEEIRRRLKRKRTLPPGYPDQLRWLARAAMTQSEDESPSEDGRDATARKDLNQLLWSLHEPLT